jgi:hypothetical protein
MLLDVVRNRFAEECELDIVTREAIAPSAGVRVHRAEPNSPLLHELYRRADLFVMPTRAECFGIATVEALASGLPVIAGDVGGARDIVDHGLTGWLIPPTSEGLASALDAALAGQDSLPAIGRQARRAAELRFDGRRNDRSVVDAMLEAADRFRSAPPVRSPVEHHAGQAGFSGGSTDSPTGPTADVLRSAERPAISHDRKQYP